MKLFERPLCPAFAKRAEHLRAMPYSLVSTRMADLVSDVLEAELQRAQNSISWAVERIIQLKRI